FHDSFGVRGLGNVLGLEDLQARDVLLEHLDSFVAGLVVAGIVDWAQVEDPYDGVGGNSRHGDCQAEKRRGGQKKSLLQHEKTSFRFPKIGLHFPSRGDSNTSLRPSGIRPWLEF